MQINRNMSAVITNNQLLRIENKLSASMERLSSGLKLNRASDNPAGIAISNKMKAQIDALDQADSNATDGIYVLQIADGALGEVGSILQRMRELSVQAANGTNAYSDRQSIQSEIDELKKEVDRISRDTEYNTKQLLDGSSDIRVYGENASRFSVTDSVAAQVYKLNVNEAATQATVKLPAEAPEKGGRVTINGVVVNVIGNMDDEAYLQEIRTAAAQAGCTVSLSEDGKDMLIKSNYYGYDETIEFVMDKNMADAMNGTTNELASRNEDYAYEIVEAEMTFPKDITNILATLEEGEKETISINGVDIVIEKQDDSTKAQAAYETALREAVETAGLGLVDNGNEYIVKSDTPERELITFSYTYEVAELWGITDDYVGDYTINTRGTDADVDIPGGNENAAEIEDRKATGFTTTSTVEVEGNRVTITDNNGFSLGFLLDADYEKPDDSDETVGNFEIEVTDIGSLTIQIGANSNQDMDVRIDEISTESLYIDTVDVAVEKGADRAMVTLDEAIADLSAVRSRIGAFQNRLEYSSSSLAATEENMTAAYSGLMDTDMAEEMTEYTQQNILSQAATSVLAQANDLPQQVLSLLQ